MECREMEAVAREALAGDAESEARAREHLAVCRRCADLHGPVLEIGEQVSRLGCPALPDGFDERFAARFRARREAGTADPARSRAAVAAIVLRPWLAAALSTLGAAMVLVRIEPGVLASSPPWRGSLAATLLAALAAGAIVAGIRRSGDFTLLFATRRGPEGGRT